MELLQLRYFLALTEAENMTKTAEKLFISPSALSLSISRLEKELGVQLFTRTGRNISLNETGRVFAENVRDALDSLDYAVMQAKQKNAVSLLVDTPATWSKLLSSYIASQPGIYVNAKGTKKSEINQEMLRNDFDYWLSCSTTIDMNQKEYDMLEGRRLHDNKLYLAVPDNHPLASRKSVSLKELRNEQFLFPLKEYEFHNTCMELCRAGGFEPNIIAYCGFFVRIQMISEGKGVCFINDRYSELFRHVAVIDIDEAGDYMMNVVSIFWHKERVLSEQAKNFLEYMTMFYQE